MKVKIDKSVFEEAKDADRLLELSFLLHIILYKHRYELMLFDGEILNYDSYQKLIQSEQEIIKQVIAHSIFASVTDVGCEVKCGGELEQHDKVFSPTEAISYLMQPLSVILENGLNDSHFIKTIFRLFDPSGELMRHVNEGWIRFENAGGCTNVKNFLFAQRGYSGERQKFLHCFVLLDGDRRYPSDQEPDVKYKRLKEKMKEWGVPYHVLEKRCMENYMPDEAMNTLKNEETKGWIEAYLTLTAEQKDFISIAEGFCADLCKEDKKKVRVKESKLLKKDIKNRKKSYVRGFLPQKEQVLYKNLSPGNFLHLETGLKIGNFKTQFPKKFTDEVSVYRGNMLNRTRHQSNPLELEDIANKICSLI